MHVEKGMRTEVGVKWRLSSEYGQEAWPGYSKNLAKWLFQNIHMTYTKGF